MYYSRQMLRMNSVRFTLGDAIADVSRRFENQLDVLSDAQNPSIGKSGRLSADENVAHEAVISVFLSS
jgi:hypothetical protein